MKRHQLIQQISGWDAAVTPEEQTMKQERFPPGWDKERVRKVLMHYEEQTEDEAVAEDEAAFEDRTHTVMTIPTALVPAIRKLLAEYQQEAGTGKQ